MAAYHTDCSVHTELLEHLQMGSVRMSGDYEHVRRRYADLFGRAGAVYGLSPLVGRLYGTLVLTPQPMTLDQLAEAVGAAKSTVSVAMRNLERYQMVRREWVRGDRRDFYFVRTDLVAMMQDLYRLFFQHEIHYVQQANVEVRELLRAVQRAPDRAPEQSPEPAPGWPTTSEQAVILQRLDETDRLIAICQNWFGELLPAIGQRELPPAEQIPIQEER